MKQLLLFFTFLCCSATLSAQNYINEVVIQREMTQFAGYTYIGQMRQTSKSIHTLDSLEIGMIIIKNRLTESNNIDERSIDTLYLKKGKIVEQISFQNCYTVKSDAEGRTLELHATRAPKSSIEKNWFVKYDKFGYPIYTLEDDLETVWEQDFRPHYNAEGILDTVRCSNNHSAETYFTLNQESFMGGDSVVITRNTYDSAHVLLDTDSFVRTAMRDTVQIRFYGGGKDGYLISTNNFVNGLLVESYFESRGVYHDVTTYNQFGLPKESFGYGVTNSGRGNIVYSYEYYSGNPKKKLRLVKLE